MSNKKIMNDKELDRVAGGSTPAPCTAADGADCAANRAKIFKNLLIQSKEYEKNTGNKIFY